MILQPCNVELTKIHYYDKNNTNINVGIPTISREIYENTLNKNELIKKNVFGHRWVLRINENEETNKNNSKYKLTLYLTVFFCIIVVVCSGIFFSIDHHFYKIDDNNIIITNMNENNDTTQQTPPKTLTDFTATIKLLPIPNRTYCTECLKFEQVCLKLEETEKPKCVQIVDSKDPTGCGGNCKIETEYCQLLDKDNQVYQCSRLKHLLKCPAETFNCGNMCVKKEKKCNGVMDCSNGSDEENCECNLQTHFQCGNYTSCLEKSRMCNGIVDCWDKTDEIGCKKAPTCKDNEIPCINGQCILKEQFCDGHFDCQDRTDEPKWCQK